MIPYLIISTQVYINMMVYISINYVALHNIVFVIYNLAYYFSRLFAVDFRDYTVSHNFSIDSRFCKSENWPT